MSLMQFLVATKSLKTVKDAPSPYKMDETNLLPKFAKKAEAGLEASAAKASQQAIKPLAHSTAKPPDQTTKMVRQSGWAGFRRIFFRSRSANSKPVQAELSLEAVRVVRSSLCDSEPPGGPVKRSAAHPALPKTPSVAGQWWTRLQTRLFALRRKQS